MLQKSLYLQTPFGTTGLSSAWVFPIRCQPSLNSPRDLIYGFRYHESRLYYESQCTHVACVSTRSLATNLHKGSGYFDSTLVTEFGPTRATHVEASICSLHNQSTTRTAFPIIPSCELQNLHIKLISLFLRKSLILSTTKLSTTCTTSK